MNDRDTRVFVLLTGSTAVAVALFFAAARFIP